MTHKALPRWVYRVQWDISKQMWTHITRLHEGRKTVPGTIEYGPDFNLKRDAVADARRLAKNSGIPTRQNSQLIIYNKTGKIEREWTYGDDPKRRKG